MMRNDRLLISAWALLLSACTAMAASPETMARIDISGGGKDQIDLELVSVSGEAKATYADWLPSDQQKKNIVGNFPATNEWQEASITIKPAKSGNISFSLMGPYIMEEAATKKVRCVQMDFDDVQGDTAVIKNGTFEKRDNDGRPAYWYAVDVAKSNPPVTDANRARVLKEGAKEGEYFLRSWHNSRVGQTMFVEAGTSLTIKFYYRLSPQ